jgi:HK97 family phage major capsid protein
MEQLGGAVKDLASAHKELAEKVIAEVKARGDNLGDWPAFKTKIAEIEKSAKDKAAELESKVKELQDAVAKYDKIVKALDGGEGETALTRFDPGYHNPGQGRRMPNAKAATALAHFVRAVITKNKASVEYLEKLGIDVRTIESVEKAGSVHNDELGGYLLPPEFGGVIIGAMPSYGVFAANAEIETMASDKKTFAKDGTDVQVYPLEEHADIDEVDGAYSQVSLEAKTFGAFARWSLDFEDYGLAGQGEAWASRFARAIARKQDQCGFLGDGTKPFANMVGAMNNGDVGLVSLPAGKTAFSDLTHGDIVNVMAAVPDEVYEEGNCKFYMSNNITWLLAKLVDGTGRLLYADAREGVTSTIMGEPIVRAAVMPKVSASGAGKKFMLFGDLRRACKLGMRTRMVIAFSPHAYFRQGQHALRVVTRFGVQSTFASSLVALKTADA